MLLAAVWAQGDDVDAYAPERFAVAALPIGGNF